MSVDYPGAIDMLLPDSYTFDSVAPLSIVIHQTGGDFSLESIHNTFLATMRSTHFGIDRQGQISQFVPLTRGAGGNCCPDRDSSGNLLCDSYWYGYLQQYRNLNLCTISIEHCNDSNNSLPLTPAQLTSSYQLVAWLCRRYNIASQHIQGHNSINPVNKPNCPGSYDLVALRKYIDTQGRNPHMEQQFDQIWASKAGSYISGIAKIVKAGFLAHCYSACFATSPEIATVDWNGNPILWQSLSNGCYVAYAAGRATIYDGFNRTLYSG